MCLPASDHRFDPIMRAGLVFFLIANLARYTIGRYALLPASRADTVSGFLMGVAIGLLLLGLYRRRVRFIDR